MYEGETMRDIMGNKNNKAFDLEPFIEEIRNNAKGKAFYLNAIRALLVFLKGFSLDQKEIDSDLFLKQIDNLSDNIRKRKRSRGR